MEALEGEIDFFSEGQIEEASIIRTDLDSLLTSIKTSELKLASSYVKLGHLLNKVQTARYWLEWGHHSWGSYIDEVRDKIGRGRSQVYGILAAVEQLSPYVSELDMESMGVSRAQALARYVKRSGCRVTPFLLEQALNPKVTLAELTSSVSSALHEEDAPKGKWRDFGFFATAEEWKEIEQAMDAARRIDPPIEADTPDHVALKEIMLRFSQEFASTYADVLDN